MASRAAAQMFTLREHTKTGRDFADALERVSKMGYPAVQLSAVGCMNGEAPEVNAADARKMLDDNGLKCIATHRSWDALSGTTEAEIAFHQTLGCDYAAIGSLPGPYREKGAEGYAAFVKDSRPVSEQLRAAGITFGYHNHSFEFAPAGFGQRTCYDVLIEEGDALLALEIDTYWVQHGGSSPERLIERCAGRVPVIHVKDMGVDPKEGPVMTPIGEGNLDWDHILPACEKAGVNWYAVEQDRCYRDPFDCLKSSFDFLSSKGV